MLQNTLSIYNACMVIIMKAVRLRLYYWLCGLVLSAYSHSFLFGGMNEFFQKEKN